MWAFITLKLPGNSPKTEPGANKFLGLLEVRAAPFAPLRSLHFSRPGTEIAKFSPLYGGAYKAPSLDATLWYDATPWDDATLWMDATLLNHPWLKGNLDLIPEKQGTLEAQISYRSNRVQASVNFYRRQKDLMIQNGARFQSVYYNDAAPVDYFGGTVAKTRSRGPSPLGKPRASYRLANGGTISGFEAYQSRIRPHALSAPARFDLLKHGRKKRRRNDDARGFALFLDGTNLLNKPVWLPALGANAIPVGVGLWRKQNS